MVGAHRIRDLRAVNTAGASPPPKATQALRSDDGRLVRGRRSRLRLLEAARALFREHGFDRATLRAIAERAGMGTSSIYRHFRSKEELLIADLAERQEDAWHSFRTGEQAGADARTRLRHFFDHQHRLLAADRDFTTIALRALSQPEARVARRVLALQDRSIGLLAEILMQGRARGELAREVDVLEAARALFYSALGTRTAWANAMLTTDACRDAIETNVDLLFRGIGAVARGRSEKS